MDLKLNKYLIYPIEDQGVFIIQTKGNIIQTTNRILVDMLIQFERDIVEVISVEMILEFFSAADMEKLELIDFLIDNELAVSFKASNIDFSKITVLSNDAKFRESFSFFFESSDRTVIELSSISEISENSTLLIILNPFSISEFHLVVNAISNYENIVCKVMFTYKNSIYISNYYSKHWSNPCPRCFLGNVERQLRQNFLEISEFDFELISDIFYKEQENYVYEGLLQSYDWIVPFHILLRDFVSKKILTDIDVCYEINLNDYSVKKDNAYYWGACDCHE